MSHHGHHHGFQEQEQRGFRMRDTLRNRFAGAGEHFRRDNLQEHFSQATRRGIGLRNPSSWVRRREHDLNDLDPHLDGRQ